MNGTPRLCAQCRELFRLGRSSGEVFSIKAVRDAVGGVVVIRYGANALEVIEDVKAKIAALESGLPKGVRIVPFYDRSSLIRHAVDTLKIRPD